LQRRHLGGTIVTVIIDFKQVSFAWLKPDAPKNPKDCTPEDLEIILEHLDLSIPTGMVSVLGPNGVGKTTLLLLAGARIQPLSGQITIAGRNSSDFYQAYQNPHIEAERNELVSFVYQNMEFETEETLGEILSSMAESADTFKAAWLRKAIDALDLADCLHARPQSLAKGQLQRAVIALALYYGSPIIIMDEPVFALEDPRKRQVFNFLREYSSATGTTIIYSAHDFDLCRDFSDHSLLLWRENKQLHHRLGPSAEICAPATIEQAYRTPMNTLFQKERLYRQMLNNQKGNS
jgi:ABC-type cobalamin/Fe3+-siderophores transport system ATPase subunit